MSRPEKSLHLRAQEARLIALEKELKQLRTTIRGLRTRLGNMQENIRELQRASFQAVHAFEERFRTALVRVRALFDKLTNDPRLSLKDRRELRELYSTIPAEDELEPLESAWEEWESHEGRAKQEDFFAQFRQSPPEQEKRSIRSLYLELSKAFHPDRATDLREEKRLKELQQQVVEAYERHDVQALYDLRDFQADPTRGIEEVGTDLLQGKIDRLEREKELLTRQKERLSAEVKALRKSDAGQMLSIADSMARSGYSFTEMLGYSEESAQGMEQILEALEDTDRLARISPLFDQIVQTHIADMEPDYLAEFLAEFDEIVRPDHGRFDEEDRADFDEEEAFQAGEDWFADDRANLHPRPKFPTGAPVVFREGCVMDYVDSYGQEQFLDLEGLSGKVFIPMLDPLTQKATYHVRLDGPSLRRLPPEYIDALVWDNEPIDLLLYVEGKQLRQKKVKRRESDDHQRRVCREITYQFLFDEMEGNQTDLLRRILFAHPAKSDAANWIHWLEEHLPLPMEALTRWAGESWKPNQRVEIIRGIGFNDELGLLVFVHIKDDYAIFPLSDFWISEKSFASDVLEAYAEWDEIRPVPGI